MKLSVEIPEEQAAKLIASAKKLGIDSNKLANALLVDQLIHRKQTLNLQHLLS